MKKIINSLSGIIFFVLCFNLVKAQGVLDGIYVKDNVPTRKPIPYNYIREADMMWTKKIWRTLDLRERLNFPLYYPTNPVDDRMSLIDIILKGANKGYDMNENGTGPHLTIFDSPLEVKVSEFLAPINPNGLADSAKLTEYFNNKFNVRKTKTARIDLTTGQATGDSLETQSTLTSSEVWRYMMKEEWYFDKQRSKMEVRIVGICPIRIYHDKNAPTTSTGAVGGASGAGGGGETEEEMKATKVCWVYFPALRPLLANHEVYNEFNDAERRTFDDIFFKRKFSSFIIQETNVYNNRLIGEYAYGLDAQFEAEKVKDYIFKLEHDLWEY